jgi:hypothetical protein
MPECRSNAVPPFKASTTREPSSYHSGWNMPTSMIGTTDTPRRLDTSPTSRFHTAWTLNGHSTFVLGMALVAPKPTSMITLTNDKVG